MAARNDISWRDSGIAAAVTTAQPRFFHLAERAGFTRKVIHLATGIPLGTLKDWANDTQMPMAGFAAIIGIKDFPNDIASVLIEASGKAIADSEPEETDLDDEVIAGLELALLWARARHPASSSGIRIDHTERPAVSLAGRRLADRARKVAQG